MRDSITSLDLHYLTEEMQSLTDSRVNKIYQKEEDFLFSLHKPQEGRRYLRVVIPDVIFPTQYKPDVPSHPPGFCMFLRKHVGGTFIRDIKQYGFDRVVEIQLEHHILIIELFSKGNLILCDDDYTILSPFHSQSWQAREITSGERYEHPPEQVDTTTVTVDDVTTILEESDMTEIVKTLAVDFGLGGVYAEEICKRNGFDKQTPPNQADPETVHKAVNDILDQEIQANTHDDYIFPFPLETKPAENHYDSFAKAIDETMSKRLVRSEAQQKEELRQERKEEIKNVLQKQRQHLEKLKHDAEENQKKAELIYEHYQDIQELLQSIQDDKEQLSWDELKQKYTSLEFVDDIMQDEATVILNIEE